MDTKGSFGESPAVGGGQSLSELNQRGLTLFPSYAVLRWGTPGKSTDG